MMLSWQVLCYAVAAWVVRLPDALPHLLAASRTHCWKPLLLLLLLLLLLQGHAARVTSVAFDEELIVSGDTSSIVKLWGMDDLRCRYVQVVHCPSASVQ